MRLLFFGSGEFGLPTLERLHARHEVAAVISQPDRPAGRHRQLTPTPIAQWATAAGLAVFKVENVNEPAFVEKVAALRPDASIVIAFGQKLGEPLIAAMGRLAVNLHASLLPKYRGAAPINWAIINGERETGVSVIALAQRMDAGLIYGHATTPIDSLETAGELHDRLAAMGPDVIEQVLREMQDGTLSGKPQDESKATKAPKLSKDHSSISFDAPADAVCWRVHGLTPWPGAKVTWVRAADGREQPLTLLRVAAETVSVTAEPGTVLDDVRVAARDGAVRLLEVQVPGGRAMSADDFVRGHRLAPSDRLTSDASRT